MTAIRLVLGDQLSRTLASLRDLDPVTDTVLMVEVREEATYVRHHKQKIALFLAAMRHFAESLRREGIRVDYVTLDDPANTHSITTELARAVARHSPARVVCTEPGEWRLRSSMNGWSAALNLPVEIREDDRFVCSHARFRQWASGRTQLRMEFFYREMRRDTGYLMDGDDPVGGQWNFDVENRKRLGRKEIVPLRRFPKPDAVTRAVLDLVAREFSDHFGDLEPFAWEVTRDGALRALDRFIEDCLPRFGDYQDAMRAGEPFVYHSVISPYLNLGLLDPREVCDRAQRALAEKRAPLNAVEGFIRQVIGWREFVRGIYWLKMPDYARTNALSATRPLPSFYWTAETAMRCVAETVRDTRRHAYAHHIQRLMVTGNLALLAGVRPAEVEDWYLAVYADAVEWVELPNTHGMALFADGGVLASKPYAASGAYIDRMSDYCDGCAYDPKAKAGPKACPLNHLYWNFLLENEPVLGKNPRMALPYRALAGLGAERREEIRRDAKAFLAREFPER